MMVDNLQAAFDRLTEKYIHRLSSSDEEIAVEYQLPTPSRKHKLKSSESPSRHKRKKRKSQSDEGEPKSSSSDVVQEDKPENKEHESIENVKESHKNKHEKGKKKRKRHGKHSKNHKKNSHKSNHESKKSKKRKDREGKKSKQKKKKNKHHDVDPPQVLNRSASQESLESSNRSRSASPLPSIHTPSPSPTELDKSEPNTDADNDFLKDKFDKIKERRRHNAKEAWDSLFDLKQKTDNQKQNLNIQAKDKNQKLRETIEKLKAKNEKFKDTSIFNNLYNTGVLDNETDESNINKKETNKDEEYLDNDNVEKAKTKSASKKVKKSSAKNESASEALEQAVKDISKWLDDAPKGSALSSPCDSPAQTISTEEQDNSRLDDEFSQGEKFMFARKDMSRKRPSSREPKIIKRREIQRTIDRLQPGKSKGNLLTNMTNKNTEKQEEAAPLGNQSKVGDNKAGEASPKLSLGSVLPTVEFTLGNDHNFSNDESKTETEKDKDNTTEDVKDEAKVEEPEEAQPKESTSTPAKKDAEVETEPQVIAKPSQEKATPNLSAWFKAFGAPKATTSTAPVVKKKVEESENEEKPVESTNVETANKITSPKATAKFDSPNDPNSPLPDGGDSPLLSVIATPRQRRTSTGSSISERSSFSQDLDSPRHQMSLTSPLLRSPASPRTDDFQKITYPIINGTVRAGFYQDTTSLKSSPEKSCSPREAPQSPYSPYSQHVYASNSATGSSTPNYFVDHNKSPLPTYGQNAPPYYDTSKAPVVNKPGRVHDDYTALGPDNFAQNHYNGPYSPVPSPYPPTQTTYSQPQVSPQPATPSLQQTNSSVPIDSKNSLFPVKKRTYNEPEQVHSPVKKTADQNDTLTGTTKPDYSKPAQPSHSVQISSASVDDIALALSEKTEMAKLNNLREKATVDFTAHVRSRDKAFNSNEQITHDNKKEGHNVDLTKPAATSKKENIDMINMGYLNTENRRSSGENAEIDFSVPSKLNPSTQQKGFEIEAIAINLGLNNQHLAKTLNKPTVSTTNITPAHSHERSSVDVSTNQNIAHAHHNQYDSLPTNQISNFSLNDIELANKKLYSCNTATSTATALDYGNWKMTNQLRKSEVVPSDYSTVYNPSNDEKLKTTLNTSATTTALNYNKNMQHPQYSNYNNVPRTSIARSQEMQQNLPGELRIPNPRGILKSDAITASSSISDSVTMAKNVETVAKSSKPDKLVQNHPLVSSLPYKTPYSSHSTIPIETLRNLPSISPMLERYTNEERYLSSFAGSTSLYHDKTFQMAQMFNKASDVLPSSASVGIYSQASSAISKDNSAYKISNTSTNQADVKKAKRKKTSETKQAQIVSSQSYHSSSCNNDVLSSVKSSMMSASPFNFGTTTNMALGSMYGDNGGFSIEDFRNSTNQLMAANYMAVAVAQQQRNNEANAEKLAKSTHQNSNHGAGSFPFLSSQVRAGYPFVGADPSSPLYQQYIQRYQEELQRQTGAQIMGLYPPTYPSSLGVRQPYDTINRPSWL